jgi:hypothetical protein
VPVDAGLEIVQLLLDTAADVTQLPWRPTVTIIVIAMPRSRDPPAKDCMALMVASAASLI